MPTTMSSTTSITMTTPTTITGTIRIVIIAITGTTARIIPGRSPTLTIITATVSTIHPMTVLILILISAINRKRERIEKR